MRHSGIHFKSRHYMAALLAVFALTGSGMVLAAPVSYDRTYDYVNVQVPDASEGSAIHAKYV